MRTLTLLSALLALALSGCGEAAPPPITTQFDTLASGAVVATSGELGAWDVGNEEAWVPELVTQIGASDSRDEAFLFGAIRGLAMDAMDRIYVLEGQSNEVRVFDLQGRHIRTMGRQGQGPGELLRPTGMTFSPDGLLWVADPGNGRYQLFDTTGADQGTRPRSGGVSSSTWAGGFDEEGFLREPSQTVGGLHLLRIDPSTGESLDSLPLPPDQTDRFILRKMENGQITGIGVYSIPFAPERQWGFQGNNLWMADGNSFEMLALSMAAGLDTVLVTRRDIPSEPVEAEELEGYWSTVSLTPAEVRNLDQSKIPGTKRAFERFFVDRDGYLWASRWAPGVYGSRQSAERPFDVFNRDGSFLGTLTLSMKPSPAPWVKNDLLVGVDADEMDVPLVMVYRLHGRTGAK